VRAPISGLPEIGIKYAQVGQARLACAEAISTMRAGASEATLLRFARNDSMGA
jgi:hypothetical protein